MNTLIKTTVIPHKARPAKRVRYDRAHLGDTLDAAHRLAAGTGNTYIITPTYNGWSIALEGKFGICTDYYRVTATTIEQWQY